MPAAWTRAAAHAVATAGCLPGMDSFAVVSRTLAAQGAGRPQVITPLNQAEALLAEAQRRLQKNDPIGAVAAADGARGQVEESFFRNCRPAAREFRAVWCHRGWGVDGVPWSQSVPHLAACGFNAVFPNLVWPGKVYFPSRIIPAATEPAATGDQLAACLAACRSAGVALHVWVVCFNLGDGVDPAWLASLRRDGRLQASRDGGTGKPWLCPTDPRNRALLADVVSEMLHAYAVDGIHLDYIRFPGQEFCFCPGCRQRFEAARGAAVAPWPAAVRDHAAVAREWLDFRRTAITDTVRTLADTARRVRPGVKVSAAVYPNWPTARDSVAQDWVQWCRDGLLDFVCPMDYTPDRDGFADLVTRQQGWLAGTRAAIVPGIGLTAGEMRPVDAAAQVLLTRERGTGGFILFEYTLNTANTALLQFAKGLTARTAPAP